MPHRHFTDSRGAEWVAYDVTPRADERRTENRRRGDQVAIQESEERRGEDRRVAVSGTRPVRLTQGWLCFERDGERRRLQPIPLTWNVLPDAELAQLLDQAQPAPLRKGADESAGSGPP